MSNWTHLYYSKHITIMATLEGWVPSPIVPLPLAFEPKETSSSSRDPVFVDTSFETTNHRAASPNMNCGGKLFAYKKMKVVGKVYSSVDVS